VTLLIKGNKEQKRQEEATSNDCNSKRHSLPDFLRAICNKTRRRQGRDRCCLVTDVVLTADQGKGGTEPKARDVTDRQGRRSGCHETERVRGDRVQGITYVDVWVEGFSPTGDMCDSPLDIDITILCVEQERSSGNVDYVDVKLGGMR
jgi:hypothetical protein